MLYFARAEVVQERSPLLVRIEVFGDTLRKQNVSGIAAIHHSLGHVNSSARKVGLFIYIHDAANWTAVNSHPQLQVRLFLERPADLNCTLHRRFRTRVKYQRHSVPSWDLK